MPSGQYNVFELSTGSTVGLSTTSVVYIQAVTPSTANVLSGVTNSTGSNLLAIPASRWWKGSLALTGSLLNNSTTANLAVTYQILTFGASIVPNAQGLLDCTIEVGTANTGVASTNTNSASISEVYVYGGSTGGALQLVAGTGTFIHAGASATGQLL